VNFPRREVTITFSSSQLALSDLVALLASLGYEPRLTLGEMDKPPRNSTRRRQWLQLGLAGFAFGNIMLFSLPLYLGLDTFSHKTFTTLFGWLSLLLALPVLLYSASDYWRAGFISLRQRIITLDVPIALGLAAIYLQSAYEILTDTGLGYCDSLTGLIFFLLCGRLFQSKTHDRIVFDRDYKAFFPLAVLRKGRTSEQTVAISEVCVGDRLVLRHGELLPADARLLHGHAVLDYSFVTGESQPVEKQTGDYLYAGGRQTSGRIEVETLKPVSQSYLTSLWNHEAFRKDRDDNLNNLTNHYSRRFTRIVLAVAVTSALAWVLSGNPPRGLKAFISVLIVACPCALALAAPVALGTAQRLFTRWKVFVKNVLVLERMASVDTIVFDKTGTLTSTRPASVTFAGSPLSEAEQALVRGLVCHSTHPHSVRIAQLFSPADGANQVERFSETPGSGIQGHFEGHEVWLGSTAWFQSRGVTAPAVITGTPSSVVCLAIDRRFRGAFQFSPSLRPAIADLLHQLGNSFHLALLSGDNDRDKARFQSLCGPNARLLFNQTPLEKLEFIRQLQAQNHTVMMVGDGLNDSGALQQSDVGVAVVDEIGAFSPASDLIVEGNSISRLAEMLQLARRTVLIVRVSFLISAVYNLIGISIAAAGVLSPLVCAILMPLSSLSVVLFACGATHWAARCHLAVNSSACIPASMAAEPILPSSQGPLTSTAIPNYS
jgi:Cu+-exporting ATPase